MKYSLIILVSCLMLFSSCCPFLCSCDEFTVTRCTSIGSASLSLNDVVQDTLLAEDIDFLITKGDTLHLSLWIPSMTIQLALLEVDSKWILLQHNLNYSPGSVLWVIDQSSFDASFSNFENSLTCSSNNRDPRGSFEVERPYFFPEAVVGDIHFDMESTNGKKQTIEIQIDYLTEVSFENDSEC